MKTHVAFLRGINVGGNSMLAMKDLAAICTELGWNDVRTYLNSGNVLFQSSAAGPALEKQLEAALNQKMERKIKVVVREVKELKAMVDGNPFPEGKPPQIGILLASEPLPKSIATKFVTPGRERVVAGQREVYIHFPDGMGRSKLKWPASLKDGTVRNLNTLTKLVSLAEA